MKQHVIKYRIKEKSLLARLAAFNLGSSNVAMVIGRTIHLHNVGREEFTQNKKWLRHEQEHLKQFQEHGFLPFLMKYLWESLRSGYFHNKYEVAARAAEAEVS